MPDANKLAAVGPQNRAAMGTRARRIREAVVGAKLNPVDQERVAENVWRMLDEAERRGHRKATIFQTARISGPGDSTKHLMRYALDPDLTDPTKRQAKAAHLTKTAAKYLRIAEAVGFLLERDADAFVPKLFNGTPFAGIGDGAIAEDVHVELAGLVRRVAAGIARRHDLRRTFRLCDERYLCRYRNSPRQNRHCRWSDVWNGFADGARVRGTIDDIGHWSLPYPSVLVGWGELTRGIPFAVRPTNPKGFATRTSHVGGNGDSRKPQLVHLTGDLVLEVRLALLPLGPGGEIEPAFVTCPWVAIPSAGAVAATPLQGKYGIRGLPRSCEQGGLDFELEDDIAGQAAFEPFAGLEPDLSYADLYGSDHAIRVDFVSPESCRRLLTLNAAVSPATGWRPSTVVDDLDPALDAMTTDERDQYWRGFDEASPDDAESPKWRSPPGTLAETLEYSLLHIVPHGPVRPFVELLEVASDRVAKEVSELVQSHDQAREEGKARLLAQWGGGCLPEHNP